MTNRIDSSPNLDNLTAAQAYASYCWPVLPLHSADDAGCTCEDIHCRTPAKHPRTDLVRHGVLDATTNKGTIAAWPDEGINIGIALGEIAGGLMVFDVDDLQVAKKLAQRSVGLRDLTAAVGTGRPGLHVYMMSTGQTKTLHVRSIEGRRIGEIRGDGSYVVAPPSRAATGRVYTWVPRFDPAARPDIVKVEDPYQFVRDLLSRVGVEAQVSDQHLADGIDASVEVVPFDPHQLPDFDAARYFRFRRLVQGNLEVGESGRAKDRSGKLYRLAAEYAEHADDPQEDVVAGIVKWVDTYVLVYGKFLGRRDADKNYLTIARKVLTDAWNTRNIRNTESTRAGLFSDVSLFSSSIDTALQGQAGEVVRTIEPHTEAHPMALLGNLLAAFGNATGRGPHMRVGADRHEPRLFLVLVGSTAKARKGQSWSEVRRLFRVAAEEWVGTRVKSGLSTGEGLIWEVRDEVHKWDSRNSQLVVDDPGVGDKRLLVMEPEFARTLKVMGREGNTLSAVIRQAWDDGNLRVMARSSRTTATDAYISILGHITAEELHRELTDTDALSGFANRFLWVGVTRSGLLPLGGRVPEEDVNRLADGLRDALSFAGQAAEMEFSEPAGRLWNIAYSRLSDVKPGMAGAMAARSEAQVLRLSMLYALMDKSTVIGFEHLKAALAFWEHCKRTVEAICGDRSGDRIADRVLSALTGRARTKDELYAVLGRNVNAERLDAALSRLKAQGLARSETQPTGGRPREVWVAVRRVENNEKYEKSPRQPKGGNVITLDFRKGGHAA